MTLSIHSLIVWKVLYSPPLKPDRVIKSIKMFKVGDHGEVPGPEVYWMRDFDKWHRLSFYSFLFETESGLALLNTGLPGDLTLRNDFLRKWAGSDRCKFTVREEEKIERALERAGVGPNEVRAVIISPVQDYTIGGLKTFRRAEIFFSKRGWFEDVVNPLPSPFLNRDIYLPKEIRSYIFEEAWNRIRLVEDQEVMEGLRVKWTGCHHRSSMAIIADTGKGKTCVTDAAFTYRNLEEEIPIGIAEDIYECLNAYRELKDLCNRIIPAYDPENLVRFGDLVI